MNKKIVASMDLVFDGSAQERWCKLAEEVSSKFGEGCLDDESFRNEVKKLSEERNIDITLLKRM